jgi:hypothetical protein
VPEALAEELDRVVAIERLDGELLHAAPQPADSSFMNPAGSGGRIRPGEVRARPASDCLSQWPAASMLGKSSERIEALRAMEETRRNDVASVRQAGLNLARTEKRRANGSPRRSDSASKGQAARMTTKTPGDDHIRLLPAHEFRQQWSDRRR